MNVEDTARCQRAIELAESGQRYTAYKEFCALYNQGNAGDTTLLSWIAYTTTSLEEAQRAIVEIARLEPAHPRLDYLLRYVSRQQQRGGYGQPGGRMGPMLQCPYCHYEGSARIARKISAFGWIWCAACFVLFLFCRFALAPVDQVTSMGNAGVFFLLLCIVGFFIKKDYYVCSSCGIALGDVSR